MAAPTVWIVNPYGSLPSESWATYRSTMLAEALAGHGYEVTQFISNFEHRSKTFRTSGFERIDAGKGYTIRIIPGTGYHSHVSLRRIRHERSFARHLVDAIGAEAPPDLVVLAEPALFYYDILVGPLIANGRSILVLDIIDIWPELFELVIPRSLRAFSNVLLAPLYYWRKRLYRHPKAIVAVARSYLDIAKRLAQRPDVLFEVVYWSYQPAANDRKRPTTPAVAQLIARKTEGEIWVVYAGTLGDNYDIQSVIDVAHRLPRDLMEQRRVKFIVAGDGPLKTLCEENATADFMFLGRLGASDLEVLFGHCDVALATYRGESTVAMPIKAFDYLRHGLPIVNSLGRDLGQLVRQADVGVNYDPESSSSLYDAVRRLACDDAFRKRCADNARTLAREFRPEVQYEKFVEVLRRLTPSEEPSGRCAATAARPPSA